ncbi:hypothetical protein J2046_006567 [Rhizobium petrolearium]|uniref:CopG family transcriptional regulator n=2 Tax=Neorhizobium TaxID=1525371 RepID=A0ABV0MC32_9HYPH|nr:hypothetical protein [Neorhizobium petrolearium]MBP1848276.1 hypothetical protein [Neorhizobium petrolearium]MCC2614431.1 hypothetical protein [Neorhizobium petrolearium]WGI72528.1 hypothetical protein QEO92_32060 [Neorhizobium petrolearium]
MSKATLGLGDFTIAGRSSSPSKAADASAEIPSRPASADPETSAAGVSSDDGENGSRILNKRSPAEREKRAKERAVAQEEARHSIKNLKRAKQREAKFFVNVALDFATKARLKRAADENDVKMAAVMKAAIDFYLEENGY